MEPLIKIRNLKRIYKMGTEKVYALNGVDLDIYQGEILCLLGTSGSGKSTLLNMIAGLDRPTEGTIQIGNVNFTSLSEKQITHFRQLYVGFVFQSYNLIPTLSALDNVALGLIFKGVPKKERDKHSMEILEKVGLGDRVHHKPSEMSGGQQQRVSIARAFVDKPRIVFADEPTGNLDTKTSFEVMNLMCQMARDYNQTLIIVTHDVDTSIYADRIVELRDGKIVREELNDAEIPKKGQEKKPKAEDESPTDEASDEASEVKEIPTEEVSDEASEVKDETPTEEIENADADTSEESVESEGEIEEEREDEGIEEPQEVIEEAEAGPSDGKDEENNSLNIDENKSESEEKNENI